MTATALLQKSILVLPLLLGASVGLATMVDTLPAGINSPSVRMGYITGIEQRYTNSSDLYRVGYLKSIQFNSENLKRLSSRAATLIRTLDNFGNSQLGQNINYGVLKIDTKPEIQYTAPVYARGITDRWTLGVGLPIIHYKNKVQLVQEGSNLEYYRSQFSSDLDPELTAALNLDMASEAKSVINSLGYKPIESRDETYLGDIQLVSAYRFWETKSQGALYTLTFNLPTGPKYDPDDLLALNSFERTSIENRVTASQMLGSSLELAPYLSHQYYFQDQVEMRVPKSESDALPDQSTKEKVRRKIGDTAMLGLEAYLSLGDRWSFGVGYAAAEKRRDQFSGDRGGRYDLLETETETDARYKRMNGQIQYSTIKAYMKKQAFMPAVIAYNYIDTVSGQNIERRTVNEINMMMFF